MFFLLELIAAFQAVPPHEVSTISIVAVIGLATIAIQIHFSSTTKANIQGIVSERLNAHDDRLDNLEDSKSQLWTEVNSHSNRLVKIETKIENRRHQ